MNGVEPPQRSPPSPQAPKTKKRPHQSDENGSLVPISKRRTERKVSARSKPKEIGTNTGKQLRNRNVNISSSPDEVNPASGTIIPDSDVLIDITNTQAADTSKNHMQNAHNCVRNEQNSVRNHGDPASTDKETDNDDMQCSEIIPAKSTPNANDRVVAKETWTLNDEVLAELKCAYCTEMFGIRPSGYYKVDPYRGPALRCKMCTRRFQGRSVLTLLHAAAHSPVVFQALRNAERWVAANKKLIAYQKKNQLEQPDLIQLAMKGHRKEFLCPSCETRGRFVLDKSNGRRVIRCTECRKLLSGEAADYVVTSALGSKWKEQVRRENRIMGNKENYGTQDDRARTPSEAPVANARCTSVMEIQHDVEENVQLVSEKLAQPVEPVERPLQRPHDAAITKQSTTRSSEAGSDASPEQQSVNVSRNDWETLIETVKRMESTIKALKTQNQVLTEKVERLTKSQENCQTNLSFPNVQVNAHGDNREWPPLHHPQREHSLESDNPPNQDVPQAGKSTTTWSNVVRQERMANLPDEKRVKIHQTLRAINMSNLRITTTPATDVVYVKGLRRSPYGLVRKSLQHSVPRAGLLGLSYIGGSILEIVTMKSEKQNLIETLQLLGLRLMPTFSITDDSLKKQGETSDKKQREKQNLMRIVRRMQRCVRNSRNGLATRWYAARLKEANDRLQQISNEKNAAEHAQSTDPIVLEGTPAAPHVVHEKENEGSDAVSPKENHTNSNVTAPEQVRSPAVEMQPQSDGPAVCSTQNEHDKDADMQDGGPEQNQTSNQSQ